MARNTRQFSDIGLSFTTHPATFDIVKKNNEEAVKASVRNLISTRNYERPFHPEIGCQIYSLLFEPLNSVTVQVMKRTIIDVLRKFEPRIEVIDVLIDESLDNNNIDVQVVFKIINTARPVTVKTSITRVR